MKLAVMQVKNSLSSVWVNQASILKPMNSSLSV